MQLTKHLSDEAVAEISRRQIEVERAAVRIVTDRDRLPLAAEVWPLVARRGACVGMDPEIFFPPGTAAEEALGVCRQDCPVQLECLVFALINDEKFGVWGGMTRRRRRQVRQVHIRRKGPSSGIWAYCERCQARFWRDNADQRCCPTHRGGA